MPSPGDFRAAVHLVSRQFGEEKFRGKTEGRVMANTIPVPNLPTISAQEIHANNLRAFRIGNQARYELNQGLRVLHSSGLLKDLEYTSITEYAEVHFGFKRSQTSESIRVAEALDTLPLSARRFQAGGIHWSAIRAITRVAKPESEERWLEFAKGKTTVQIEDEVQDALKSGRDLPRKGRQGLSKFKIRITYEFDREEYELLKKSHRKTAAEMRARLGEGSSYPSSKEITLFQARTMLETDPKGVPVGRVERNEPLETILFHVCLKCRDAKLRTDEGPVDVPIEHAERVEETAKKVVIKPEEEGEGGEEGPAIDRPTPPALREKVLLRGGLVCANPFCRRRLGLQADHLIERSKRGRTNLANLNIFCKGCHALKSMGLLNFHKDEEGNLAVERKSDQLAASILAEAEKELSAMPRTVMAVSTRVDGGNGSKTAVSEEQARRALCTLGRIGLAEAEARRRLEAAIKGFQEAGKAPSDHDLVQEALLRMEDGSKQVPSGIRSSAI
jgi:HNH endonuclease